MILGRSLAMLVILGWILMIPVRIRVIFVILRRSLVMLGRILVIFGQDSCCFANFG